MGESSHYLRCTIAIFLSAALIYGDLYLSAFDDLRGGMSLLLTPFRTAAALPRDSYETAREYLRSREAIVDEKVELEKRLLDQSVRLKSLDFYHAQNQQLRNLLQLKQSLPGKWLAAEISRSATFAAQRRIVLDKGIADGVVPGLAVVDEQGVFGQVIRSDANTSVVGLIIDPGQWIGARVQRNNLLVILRGDGDRLALEYVANEADIVVGDLLVADGGLYPPGYPVAVIDALEEDVVYKIGSALPVSDFSSNFFALLYFANVDGIADGSEKNSANGVSAQN